MHAENPKDAVQTALMDRLSHPVLGVYLLALVVSNWKFVTFLIISELPADLRIRDAAKYLTIGAMLWWPILFTAIYVLLGPVLKVLAMMYDRFITNWENVRAYKAQIKVVEAKTAASLEELSITETDLKQRRVELTNAEHQLEQLRQSISREKRAR